MSVRLYRLTFDAMGRIAKAEFRCREKGLIKAMTVTVVWRDVAGDWCWFKAGWCSPENWRLITPMLERIERSVDRLRFLDA